jgi:hypothetical protein
MFSGKTAMAMPQIPWTKHTKENADGLGSIGLDTDDSYDDADATIPFLEYATLVPNPSILLAQRHLVVSLAGTAVALRCTGYTTLLDEDRATTP